MDIVVFLLQQNIVTYSFNMFYMKKYKFSNIKHAVEKCDSEKKYNVHSGLFTKVSQKRINESQIPAKSVSKENKTPQLNKTKEIENNIFPHCLAF